ncbi:MAG: ABC transporter ATP-binding protein [Rhodospirillales bacterium]|nr:ABC transporter ATP-binding protein [Rhodospirillales bacterium]
MPEPILQTEKLSKRFGAVVASDAVTLDLVAGEIHALIGPNGAGKSTVIKQVAGEIRQDSGSIRFAGRDIGRLDMVARARLGLARTFQVSSIAPEFSALQNVMLAVQSVERKTFRFLKPARSDTSLKEQAMSHLVRLLLDDRAEIRAGDLSHGEKRALEIAIALALRPKAFLLDEPMAGMGPENTAKLIEILDGLRTEAPILLVEHDMDAVFALADRISVIVYGRIIASGTPEQIRANEEVRRAYLGDEGHDGAA